MADAVHAIGKAMFDALMRGDKEATIAAFADDAEIFDPHYPRPHMRGKAEIRAGLDWGFGSMKSFGFDIKHYFPGKDGLSGVFEVDTHHVLKIGKNGDRRQQGHRAPRLRALRPERHGRRLPRHRAAEVEAVGQVS